MSSKQRTGESSMIPSTLRLILERRRALQAEFDIPRVFADIQESCIPSYCHSNPLAAAVSWWRLLAARSFYSRFHRPGPVLDFGSGTGEIHHFLDSPVDYHFVEQDERLAQTLLRWIPAAHREYSDRLEPTFATIFALDSLEHNQDIESLAALLASALRPGGHLIVSGPTENALYRFGRWVAGFQAAYHLNTIYEIEEALGSHLRRVAHRVVPAGIPLFRISVWTTIPSAAEPRRDAGVTGNAEAE